MPLQKITSVIAHTDHGKTTLLDSVIASTGHFPNSLIGDLRYLDSRKDEQEREITMKLAPIKLRSGHVFIDTPGHVDFESLLFSSAILSDNQMVLIDVNEGITPRTYSLVRFIDKRRCVLVINKIDKCTDFDVVELVLMQINGLMEEEIFSWEKNNVILSSATLGAGVSYATFKFSPKNTLSQAFRAFKVLDEKIDNNDVDQLMKKYNLRFPNKKLIFSTVMPLAAAVFNTIDHLYTGDGSEATGGDVKQSTEFYTASFEEGSTVQAITMYGVLKDRGVFTRDNVLQLVKVFGGKLTKGDMLYSATEEEQRRVVLEEIYDFSIDGFTPMESFEGPGLIYTKGDFLKNSVISSAPATCTFKNCMTPFFSSKLALADLSRIGEMKSVIRVISLTEQNLKVRLNRFSEFEFKCSGRVQFEKICHDLEDCGFNFAIREPKGEFRELATTVASYHSEEDLEIHIGPVSKFNEVCTVEDGGYRHLSPENNLYYIQSDENQNIIESVLDVFTGSGLVIRECIIDTFFYIKADQDLGISNFSSLKSTLSEVYLQAAPAIRPLCYDVVFSVSQTYTPAVYLALQKSFNNYYIIECEDYNEGTGFTTIKCKVPQCIFNVLVEEVRQRTRGTAYLEICGSGYADIGDFSYLIPEIRKEKGLFAEDKIVNEPEKQRTLKR